MCLSNKQTNTRYCLFDRLEKFCLFVWSEVVKRTKQSVQVLFGDHPGWNSVYRMLNRALCVQERLSKFCRDHKPVKKALETFEAATIVNQGYDVWLSDWFITIDRLLNRIHDWKMDALEVQGDEELAACFTASWNKIEKYYKLVDQTSVYYAAILLNPTLKRQKLREMWRTNEQRPWIEPVIQQVTEL